MSMKMKKRGWSLFALFLVASGAMVITLSALRENIVFFITPSEWMEKRFPYSGGKVLRLGGHVLKDSLLKSREGVTFFISDEKQSLKVTYKGILPDLFREGQSVVAEGTFDEKGVFIAKQILAKHDETYRPKDVCP